jgi:hypothetical protein
MKAPVAFLIFNRPDTTEKVFQAIRQAPPPQLLVVADGLRPDQPEDVIDCAVARSIIEQVDWDCQVMKNYYVLIYAIAHQLLAAVTGQIPPSADNRHNISQGKLASVDRLRKIFLNS